jgi:hypothetical protein
MLEIDQAGLRRLTERAAAPQASERAALEKHHRANARPVFEHIFGGVENGSPPPRRSIRIFPARLHGVMFFSRVRQPGRPFSTFSNWINGGSGGKENGFPLMRISDGTFAAAALRGRPGKRRGQGWFIGFLMN